MLSMLRNLVNGNLSDAKFQAKAFTEATIVAFLQLQTTWTKTKCRLAAIYLKTGTRFQEFCDQ